MFDDLAIYPVKQLEIFPISRPRAFGGDIEPVEFLPVF